MSFEPGTRLGPYEIVASLGAGGMGEVYRARDARLQRDVAIKVLPSSVVGDLDRLSRFTREAQLLASLNHPHIAHVYGVEHEGTTRALVMELVDGPTLADRMSNGAIPLEDALPIARQIADALDAAHERGIIHRDLKPANIKLAADGSVKVLDFGLAKTLDQGSGIRDQASGDDAHSPTLTTPAMTQAGIILGTAAYMAPEQARGRAVDKRADIWSFGVVLFEMLTGRQLFAGETVSDTIAEVLKREFDWNALPPATPLGVRRVLERALQRDPKKRLRDIGDAIAELDTVPGAEKAVSFTPASRVSPALVALVVLAVAAAAAATGWLLKPLPPEVPRPVVRFTISIDEPLRLAARQAIVVSPDGAMVAVATTAGILLHRRDAFDGTLLKSTDTVGAMTFSPDGKSLAFWSGGQIRIIELASGAAQTVYDTRLTGGAPNGLTWSTDGSLAFPTREGLGVLRPGAATPVELTVSNAVVDGLPYFMPDGQSLLYFKGATATPESHVVMLHPLNGGEPIELITGSAPQFVPPDRLLYTRGATLHAVTFDPAPTNSVRP